MKKTDEVTRCFNCAKDGFMVLPEEKFTPKRVKVICKECKAVYFINLDSEEK